MIKIQSLIRAADNAGAILFKCIRVFGGFRRRYAKLGELVSSVSYTRKRYRLVIDKLKLAKLSKKVKKKRKIKNKKKRQPNLRPYLTLLVTLRRQTRRKNGVAVKFDENYVYTFTEPTKFGPAGKTENIPNFIGTKVYSTVPLELVKNNTLRTRFRSVILKSKGIV